MDTYPPPGRAFRSPTTRSGGTSPPAPAASCQARRATTSGDTFEARFGYGLTTDPARSSTTAASPARTASSGSPTSIARSSLSGGAATDHAGGACSCPTSSSRRRTWSGRIPSNNANTYTMEGVGGGIHDQRPEPGAPRPELRRAAAPSIDWRYSWMFTGQLTSCEQRVVLRRQHRDLREPAVRHPVAGQPAVHAAGELRVADVPGRWRDGRRGGLRLQRRCHRPAQVSAGGPGYGRPPTAPCSCDGRAQMPDPSSGPATGSPTSPTSGSRQS